MNFQTDYQSILGLLDQIDPERYSRTRNFSDGAVTRLSPYISRGVISTKFVFQKVLQSGLPFEKVEKFIQELAWRDYWQQIWIEKKEQINFDLKNTQEPVRNHAVPTALVNGNTQIWAIDESIEELYETGYMHNHMRMYVASVACNMAQCHWLEPARWMYAHLLDGDWASNALSWQWVAGANANKKYFANQENINKYFYSDQRGTFLDRAYSELVIAPVPEVLQDCVIPQYGIQLPNPSRIEIDVDSKVCLYNYYNLDPEWRKSEDVKRILLLEPSIFKQYPISERCVDFMLELAKNIPGIQVYVGEYKDFIDQYEPSEVYFKEHPLNSQYQGIEDPRDWMFGVKGYYPSFFQFWKKCKKEMKDW